MDPFLPSSKCQTPAHSQVPPGVAQPTLTKSEVKVKSSLTDRIMDHHCTPLGYTLGTFCGLGLHMRKGHCMYCTAQRGVAGDAYLYLNLHRRFLLGLTQYPEV